MNIVKTHMKLSNVVIGALSCMIVAAFPALFMYFQNAGEAHFADIVPITLLFVLLGVVLFGLTLLITRKPAKAGLITIMFLFLFLNYALIENIIQKVFPELRYWHIVPILLVLLLHIAWAICRFTPDDIIEIITPVIGGVFVLLIIMNGVAAIPKITTRINAEQEARKLAGQETVSENDMPNFYFILFDEYSTIPFMQKYYGYDNSELLTKLEKLGFNISQTGHNFSSSTAIVTTDLFNLDYISGDDTSKSEELFRLRSNNPVFNQFRQAGYDIISPAGGSFYGLSDALGDKKKATTIKGETLESLLLDNTVLYPFFHSQPLEEAQIILDELAFLKNPNNFSKSNQFILAHLNLPHEPFLFDANGKIYEVASNSWRDLNFYLQQYQFTSSQILEIAEGISRNDPNAIIWILSDHGARASSDPEVLGIFSSEDMSNFFNVLYYQGKKVDIEGLSGVNTFRVILNMLFDKTYEMIPLP